MMKKVIITLLIISSTIISYGQTIKNDTIIDWNNMSRRSGFFENQNNENSKNAPGNSPWYWGLNISASKYVTGEGQYNGQVAFAINTPDQRAMLLPQMYIRSTNYYGAGVWAKVLHDQGLQTIKGGLTIQDDLILQTGDSYATPLGEYGKKLYFGYKTADNGDHIYMSRYNRGENSSDLRVNIGDDNGGGDRFVVGNARWNAPEVWRDWFVVTDLGVGINGVSAPTCALEVNGIIRAKEVKIEAVNWPDYVFSKDYNLPALSEVENHINEHKHLPNIPSEAEVKENGVDIGDLQIKLLQKIEELTLYMIEQDKQIKELKQQLNNR